MALTKIAAIALHCTSGDHANVTTGSSLAFEKGSAMRHRLWQAAWRAQSVRMQCEFEGVETYFADEEGEMPDLLPNPDTHLCTLGEDSDTAVITMEDDKPAR